MSELKITVLNAKGCAAAMFAHQLEGQPLPGRAWMASNPSCEATETHLALAALDSEDVARTLEHCGTSSRRVRMRMLAELPRVSPVDVWDASRLPLSEGARKVIERAEESHGGGALGVLCALCEEGSPLRGALEGCGVTLERVMHERGAVAG